GLDLPAATAVTAGVARIALVAKGHFLTIAFESALRFADMAIKALPVNLAKATRPAGIVTLKNRTLTPAAQLFIDCAREVAKPLPIRKSVSSRRRQFANES